MSIHLITGKPGGGKGLLAMRYIVDELREGKRNIVTNLPIRLNPWVSGAGVPHVGLRAYLQAKLGRDCDCDKRITILEDDQVSRFFLYRGGGVVCPVNEEKAGLVVGYDTGPAVEHGGCYYCVDEAWKFFGARQWQTTAAGVLFYCAQHRHLGDDLLLVTQNSKQVDTALRQVSQDFTVTQNHGKLRFGPFRQPGLFHVVTYPEPPGPGVVAMSRSVYKLDAAGLGACYDTSAGVGIVGGKSAADTQEKKKGLPWQIGIAAIVVGLAVVWSVPVLGGRFMSRHAGDGVRKPGVLTSEKSSVVAVPGGRPDNRREERPLPPASLAPSPVTRFGVSPSLPVPESPDVFVTGVVGLGGKLRVLLSNGETYSAADRELQLVTDRFCVINGKVYRWPTLHHDGGGREPGAWPGASTVGAYAAGGSEVIEGPSIGWRNQAARRFGGVQ